LAFSASKTGISFSSFSNSCFSLKVIFFFAGAGTTGAVGSIVVVALDALAVAFALATSCSFSQIRYWV